jgi:hypothetical protein
MEDHSQYLTYEEVYEMRNDCCVLRDELPTKPTVSLPLPTLRWNQPLFASFASTILSHSQRAVTQSEPLLWWLIDAHEGRLCLFTWYHIYPFAPEVHWNAMSLRPLSSTINDELVFSSLTRYMDCVAPLFFADQPGNFEMRNRLLKHIEVYVHPLILPQYLALAPDFFAWLEQDG